MRWLTAALAAALATLAGPALAAYPERPVTVVVPFAAGGATDVIARIYADHMSRTIGQQLVIENVTGAGGTIAATRVARATPDGYTLLMGSISAPRRQASGSTRTWPTTFRVPTSCRS